jgi:hypothetical protein
LQPAKYRGSGGVIGRVRCGWKGLDARTRAALQAQQRRIDEAVVPKIERDYRIAPIARG